ncbi:hypothetical protein L6452_09881 [Arctium lappa]|uniref:Uncharacterized protein n=1 Tax=Arctium lappa TaxID=4217 RepID=A0ACB9DLB0_ARCLA|nr:hypothetical protein L6452_09881 [Arctium lappa]
MWTTRLDPESWVSFGHISYRLTLLIFFVCILQIFMIHGLQNYKKRRFIQPITTSTLLPTLIFHCFRVLFFATSSPPFSYFAITTTIQFNSPLPCSGVRV